MNKPSNNLTLVNYHYIIDTLLNGAAGIRPNVRVATVLMLMAKTGRRLTDILATNVKEYQREGDKYIVQGSTQLVALDETDSQMLQAYLKKYQLQPYDKMFPITSTNVQKVLRKTADYCGLEDIHSHSFYDLYTRMNGYQVLVGDSDAKTEKSATDVPGVYSITCRYNGRIYIGQSQNISYRWEQHLQHLRAHTHHSHELQADFDHYGEQGFLFNVLLTSGVEAERKALEKTYIAALCTTRYGYNTVC